MMENIMERFELRQRNLDLVDKRGIIARFCFLLFKVRRVMCLK